MATGTLDTGTQSAIEPLPVGICSGEQVRGFDRRAIQDYDMPGIELMRRAGQAAFGALRRHYPAARNVTILCGSGNNAGDGYVVARLAHEAGFAVRALALTDPAGLPADAATAFAEAARAGVPIAPVPGGRISVQPEDLVVDAIFGSGISRPIRGGLASTIDAVNASSAAVVALDMPSGIDGDTGCVHGCAVRADLTVTFVGLKPGLYLGEGPDHSGKVEFAGLGIPALVQQTAAPVVCRMVEDALRHEFRPRRRMSHKGMNGNVLLIGGAPGMAGAIRLAGEAALRAGAGLVRVVTHPSSVLGVASGRPELMCRGVDGPDAIEAWLGAADAIVVGPGLGRSAWADALYDRVLACEQPLIVDADALNRLAERRNARRNWLLTPHPGEAARLLRTDAAAIQRDRLGAVRALADRFGADVILKGACSLVAEVSESREISVQVCDRGNPGMATGGMGDLLAGIAGALAAGRRTIRGVGAIATLLHALAGDDAARDGERGMIPSDLLGAIRRRVNPA